MSNVSFDPTMHQPPRVDEFGFNKVFKPKICDDGSNVLKQGAPNLPTSWREKPGQDIVTRTNLHAARRADKIPDISYDLDGDGHVGDRDYFLSKHFDKDGDGKLNVAEKAAARKAIGEGFEKNFFWNVEKSGVQRPYRIMQKRGVFVDAEDFLPVTDTYPRHPLSDVVPSSFNVAEMQQKRKVAYKDDVVKKSAYNADFTSKLAPPLTYVRSDFLIDKPTHTSINQRIEEDHVAARKKSNLTETCQDMKDEVVASRKPLEYVYQPRFNSKQALEEHRKKAMLEELKKNEANFETHKDAQARIEGREMCHLRAQHKEEATLTRPLIDERRRQEMIEDMTKKFGTVTVGVHGMELPKFASAEEAKAWWKYQPHCPNPAFQSRAQLKQSHKYWAQNDEMLLADKTELEAPQDHFKQTFIQKAGEKDHADKVTQQQHWDCSNLAKQTDYRKDYKLTQRWSQEAKSYQHDSYTRLYHNIVQAGYKAEEREMAREKRLEAFNNQRKKGTVPREGGNSQIQVKEMNVQPQKPIRAMNKEQQQQSVSHYSKSILQENTTSVNTQMRGADGAREIMMAASLPVGTSGLKQTLFARIGTKKESVGQSAGNEAEQTQATSQAQPMDGSAATSAPPKQLQAGCAFRDVLKKGVVSGAGMLTF